MIRCHLGHPPEPYLRKGSQACQKLLRRIYLWASQMPGQKLDGVRAELVRGYIVELRQEILLILRIELATPKERHEVPQQTLLRVGRQPPLARIKNEPLDSVLVLST